MNKLTYEISSENYLSFILKADGQPLLNHVDNEIPYWICEFGIPTYPPGEVDADRLIVGVCSCGEYGCGNTNVRIERLDGVVRLFESEEDSALRMTFEFSEDEFDKISKEIALKATEQIALEKMQGRT
jgi:hypothetical protein